MKYSLELVIPFLPVAFNVAKRMHKHKFNELNKSWYELINLYSRNRPKPAEPLKRAQLTLVRHSHRTLDYDGLVSSFKAPVDGLVKAGIIANDTWKITGPWRVDQKFLPKKENPFIEIRVEEIPLKESPLDQN